jgi:ketosteroid isomerase-like protein
MPTDESTDYRLLLEITERIFDAIRDRDVATLSGALADDFVLTVPGSPDQDRTAFLAAINEAPYRILEIHGDDVGVRLLGETAIVSGLQRAEAQLADGTKVTGTTAFVDCFERNADRWRLRHAVSIEMPVDVTRPE